MRLRHVLPLAVACVLANPALSQVQSHHLLQRPALTRPPSCSTMPATSGRCPAKAGEATRLTVGVGLETSPIVSPDGQHRGLFRRVRRQHRRLHDPDHGRRSQARHVPSRRPTCRLRSLRTARSSSAPTARHSRAIKQLFTVAPTGGPATLLPLPLAYQGNVSPDGHSLAYSPLAPAFGFNYTSYVAWGNYRGGRAGTVNVTDLATLNTVTIPHEKAQRLFAGLGQATRFISFQIARARWVSSPSTPRRKAVAEAMHNAGPDFHSLAAGPGGLVYDQLGEIYLFDPATGKSHMVPIDVTADLPEVREHIQTVSSEILGAGISPTGLRAVFEAHGEILTVPAKKGPTRDLTNTPGVMERDPAWSPDGQSICLRFRRVRPLRPPRRQPERRWHREEVRAGAHAAVLLRPEMVARLEDGSDPRQCLQPLAGRRNHWQANPRWREQPLLLGQSRVHLLARFQVDGLYARNG